MNKKLVLLSVIIPLYNCKQFLERCVNSVYNQGLNNSEFEVIIIDDGSTDGGGELADQLAAKFDNLFVIHQPNGGLGFVRNRGIDIANGRYLHFIDADDFILDGCYDYIRPMWDKDYDMICMSHQVDAPWGSKIVRGTTIKEFDDGIDFYNSNNCVTSYVWNKFYKVDFLRQNNLRFKVLAYCQDLVFTLSTLECPSKILVDDTKIMSYTTNPNGAVRNRTAKFAKRAIGALIEVNIFLDRFFTTHADEVNSHFRRVYYYRVLFSRIIGLPLSLDETKELFAKCRNLGLNKQARKYKDVNCYLFLYKHPLLYYVIQKPLSVLYFLTRKNSHDDYCKSRIKLK